MDGVANIPGRYQIDKKTEYPHGFHAQIFETDYF
jgi:hypothetical protein